MVLKYLTNRKAEVNSEEQLMEVFRDQWNYIGGIVEASIYYDDESASVVVDLEFENRPRMKIALHNEAYLLNENGKTIEKVRC